MLPNHKHLEEEQQQVMFPVGFPFGKILFTLLVLIVLIPLWVPIALSFTVYILLGLVGVPMPRAIIEFLVLTKSSYDFRLQYRRPLPQTGSQDQWEVSFQYVSVFLSVFMSVC